MQYLFGISSYLSMSNLTCQAISYTLTYYCTLITSSCLAVAPFLKKPLHTLWWNNSYNSWSWALFYWVHVALSSWIDLSQSSSAISWEVHWAQKNQYRLIFWSKKNKRKDSEWAVAVSGLVRVPTVKRIYKKSPEES